MRRVYATSGTKSSTAKTDLWWAGREDVLWEVRRIAPIYRLRSTAAAVEHAVLGWLKNPEEADISKDLLDAYRHGDEKLREILAGALETWRLKKRAMHASEAEQKVKRRRA